MEPVFDHNKLIKTIAKARLKAHNIIQKGTSRTFLYDGDWYIILIEFQPSSFGKGTYLNIGVDLNFYPRNYLAFSYGHREKEFETASSEKQFIEIVNDYCDHVILRTQELIIKFKHVTTAINTIERNYSKDDLWNCYDLGILYGLVGDTKNAKYYFNKIIQFECTYDYQLSIQNMSIGLIELARNAEEFIIRSKELITETRQLKKLSSVELSLP